MIVARITWRPQPAFGQPWPSDTRYGPRFQRWFAYRPVMLESGEWILGEYVMRRKFLRGMFYDLEWEYRRPDDVWVCRVNGAVP
jgi:hypothetical protein